MSTSEEVRERPPNPADCIAAFELSHKELVASVLLAKASPSRSLLDLVSQRVVAAGGSLFPFHENTFFKDGDNDLALAASLGSVRSAIDELVARTMEVNPESKVSITYTEPELEDAVRVMLETDGSEVHRKSADLCNTYSGLASNLEGALKNSPRVKAFIEAEQKALERTTKIKYYGGIAVAAFAGTYLANLANKFQKRG